MDELLKQMENLKDMTSVFTMGDVVLALLVSFLLSLVVAKVYQETHRGISYSQSFVQTLVLMAVVVSVIMLIVGSNIARAFSLVGALSIIRFRNAVKETRDVGFMFFAMAIGMAAGTRFYLMAVFMTATISAFIVIMYKLNLFAREVRERILMVQLPSNQDYETTFEDAFRKHFADFGLISVETLPGDGRMELVYSISLKRGFETPVFLREMAGIHPDMKFTVVEGQQQVDL